MFLSVILFVCVFERKAEEFWKLPRIVYMLAGCGIVSRRLQMKSTWKKALEIFLKFVNHFCPDFSNHLQEKTSRLVETYNVALELNRRLKHKICLKHILFYLKYFLSFNHHLQTSGWNMQCHLGIKSPTKIALFCPIDLCKSNFQPI